MSETSFDWADLRAEKRRLEDRLKRIDDAMVLLANNPEIAETLQAVEKAWDD